MSTYDSIQSGTFKEVPVIASIGSNIWSLKFSPDNSCLVIGCDKAKLHFFDLSTCTITATHLLEIEDSYGQQVTGMISSLAMPASKKVIIAATKMGFAILNYHGTKLFAAALEGWMMPRIKLSPDEKLFAISDDKRIVVYKLADFKKFMELETGGCCMGLEFSADSNYLFAGGDDGKCIHKWDLSYGGKVSVVKAHDCIILDLALRNNGELVSSAEDFVLKKWDSATGAVLPATGMANGKEYQIQFSPDDTVLATACLSRMLTFRDPNTLQVIKDVHFSDYCTSLDFSRDGKFFAAADDRGTLKLWIGQ